MDTDTDKRTKYQAAITLIEREMKRLEWDRKGLPDRTRPPGGA